MSKTRADDVTTRLKIKDKSEGMKSVDCCPPDKYPAVQSDLTAISGLSPHSVKINAIRNETK